MWLRGEVRGREVRGVKDTEDLGKQGIGQIDRGYGRGGLARETTVDG